MHSTGVKYYLSVMTLSRLIPLQTDLPLLAVYDMNIMEQRPETDFEECLRLTAQEDLQELVNALFTLPQESSCVVKMPSIYPTTKEGGSKGSILSIPRARPLPAAKPMTRWEQFAKIKGIKKRKRSAKVFDEESGEYAARHGGRSAKNIKKQQDDWCVEVD